MRDGERLSLERIRAFLEGSQELQFEAQDRAELYQWVERTLVEQEYASPVILAHTPAPIPSPSEPAAGGRNCLGSSV